MCDFRFWKRIYEVDLYMDGLFLLLNSGMDELVFLFYYGEVGMGNLSFMLSFDFCFLLMEVEIFFIIYCYLFGIFLFLFFM